MKGVIAENLIARVWGLNGFFLLGLRLKERLTRCHESKVEMVGGYVCVCS